MDHRPSRKRRRVETTRRHSERDGSAPTQPHPGLKVLRSLACEKLCGKRSVPRTSSHDAYAKVEKLLRQTIESGEGNSMLLIGPRSSNASQIVRDAIKKLSLNNPNAFHLVHLNGAIHTDDKLAVREIWRQLGREMAVDGHEDQSKSHSDTLAKLLATLTHVSAEGQNQGRTSMSVVFVLKEFDLFTYHSRQTLLYNLFDIAQSSRTPIAVLGLTTNVNVVDMLEKRVKSRFSQRHVFLPRPDTLESFKEAVRVAVQLQRGELTEEDLSHLSDAINIKQHNDPDDDINDDADEVFVDAQESLDTIQLETQNPQMHAPQEKQKNINPSTKNKKNSKRSSKSRHHPSEEAVNQSSAAKPPPDDSNSKNSIENLLKAWNAHVSTLFNDPGLADFLTRQFHTTKSIPSAYATICLFLASQPLPTNLTASPSTPISTTLTPLNAPSTTLSLLPTLPTFAVILLICAARLDVVTASDLCNLHMAYAEYTSLLSRSRLRASTGAQSGIVWSMEQAAGMWDMLVTARLLTPVVGGITRDHVDAREMCRVEVRLEEVEGAMKLGPGDGLESGLREWVREL